MSSTLVQPYVVDSTANFTINNLTITSVSANNSAGTVSTGQSGQVLMSTGSTNKTVWGDVLSPFLLMGA